MNTEITIYKNTFYLSVADSISKLFNFFYFTLIISFLTPSDFGLFTLWLSFAAIVSFTSDLGIGKYYVREIARDELKAKKFFGVISIGKLFLILITVCLYFSFTLVLDFNEVERTVGYIVFLSLILRIIILETFYTTFRAFEKMQYEAIGRLLNSTTLIITTLVAILLNKSVIEIAVTHLLTNIITLFYCCVVLVLKFFKPSIYFDYRLLMSIIRESMPFGLTNVFNKSNAWITTIFLFYFYNNEIVGYYNAATKLIDSITVFSVLIGAAIFPSLSKLFVESTKKFKALFRKYLTFIFIISCPLNFILLIYSKDIILVIFGTQYQESILVLQILSFYVSILFIRTTMARFLESTDRQILYMKISFFVMITNFILNFFLISEFGLLGASTANVLTIIISLVLCILVSNRHSHKYIERSLILSFLKILVVGILVGFFSLILKSTLLQEIFLANLVILIFLSLMTYFIMLIAFSVIKKEDIIKLKSFFKNTPQRKEI